MSQQITDSDHVDTPPSPCPGIDPWVGAFEADGLRATLVSEEYPPHNASYSRGETADIYSYFSFGRTNQPVSYRQLWDITLSPELVESRERRLNQTLQNYLHTTLHDVLLVAFGWGYEDCYIHHIRRNTSSDEYDNGIRAQVYYIVDWDSALCPCHWCRGM